MYYVIGTCCTRVSDLKSFINSISVNDRDAIFIFTGSLCNNEFGYEMLQWIMNNVTPNGRYQAILSKDGDTILKWYHEKYLVWYKSGKPSSAFPYVSREESHVLYHAKSLKHKEIVEIAKFYESLPVTKELHTIFNNRHHIFYCVESWLTDQVLEKIQKQPIVKNDLRCLKEFCLYYPPSADDYKKYYGFYLIRPDYTGKNYASGYTFNIGCSYGIHCFCVDKEQYLL